MGKVITFANAKGGVGKSSSSTALASILQCNPRKNEQSFLFWKRKDVYYVRDKKGCCYHGQRQ